MFNKIKKQIQKAGYAIKIKDHEKRIQVADNTGDREGSSFLRGNKKYLENNRNNL